MNMISYAMLFVASVFIFVIAEGIRYFLAQYQLSPLFISFCVGFILFTPLVSLVLHGLLKSASFAVVEVFDSIWANIGLVIVVQGLFFFIWMTDAVAVYSIYVDQDSFLAQTFQISSSAENANFSLTTEFYWANLLLAWGFAWLSLAIGVVPCLAARISQFGVVSSLLVGFKFAKTYWQMILLHALLIASSVVFTLLYAKFLFLLAFPIAIIYSFKKLAYKYQHQLLTE